MSKIVSDTAPIPTDAKKAASRKGRPMTLEQALGLQVRALRRKRKISARELADMAGISSGMLSKIENGRTSPSLSTILAVACALNTRLTSLFAKFEEDAVYPAPLR